jgi:hypothetical protein
VACHLDDGALVGPLPSTAVLRPHPIRRARAIYERSNLCGRCHEGTYTEWKAADPGRAEKRTCQECHMPLVVRKVTQADDALSSVLVAMEKRHSQREHRFDVGAVAHFADAARLAVSGGPDGLTVRIENRLPHALPTGDYGPRRVEVRLTWVARDGTPAGRQTLVRSVRGGNAVPALGVATTSVKPPARATRVAAVLVRPATGPEGEIVLARAEASW